MHWGRSQFFFTWPQVYYNSDSFTMQPVFSGKLWKTVVKIRPHGPVGCCKNTTTVAKMNNHKNTRIMVNHGIYFGNLVDKAFWYDIINWRGIEKPNENDYHLH